MLTIDPVKINCSGIKQKIASELWIEGFWTQKSRNLLYVVKSGMYAFYSNEPQDHVQMKSRG